MVGLATTDEQRKHVHQIRWDVFVNEQGVAPHVETDPLDDDPTTIHMLAWVNQQPVATARILPLKSGQVQVGRVAVLGHVRGQGVGGTLMEAVEKYVQNHYGDEQGRVRLELAVQAQAAGFYRSLGYILGQDTFEEAGILHHPAYKELKP